MTRYKALRQLGCEPIAAGFIAGLNWLCNVPRNEIRLMNVIIEIEDEQPKEQA